MSLEEYYRRRDFSRTPEPSGSNAGTAQGWRFVVQKHAATNLHYDLRLEMDGVLKSWAVPKGPSLDPQQKRLAIHVEDHPLEYLLFEGVIPAAEYGGGTVLVWDTGTWSPVKDPKKPEAGYASGDLKFRLDGHKLQGQWMLVHTGKRNRNTPNHWLLFKERDAAARTTEELDVLDAYPASVLSGRTLEQIAAAPDAIWSTATGPKVTTQQDAAPQAAATRVRGKKPHTAATKKAIPQRLAPALPTATRHPPSGDKWLHEIKFDGYRMLAMVQRGTKKPVRFISRNGNDWSAQLIWMQSQVSKLAGDQMILDGEIVFMGDDGRTHFQSLQNTIGSGQDRALRYCLFDILWLDGYDLRKVPFEDRKALLQDLVANCGAPALIYSDTIQGDGPLVFEKAAQLGAEGIVSKRVGSAYVSGRTDLWLKTKCLHSAEFVVGGFTNSTSEKHALGALVLGRYEDKRLIFEGKVGTGFSAETLSTLYEQLTNIEIDECPFAEIERGVEKATRFVQPTLVVEVEYGGWTNEGILRFPSYRGVRNDIKASQVIRSEDVVPSVAPTPSTTSAASQLALDGVRLTHPDRVMYPEVGITKLGLATYYAQVADWMLPHVIGRPLSLVRFPKGLGSSSFFQKSLPSGMPASVRPMKFPTEKGREHHALVIEDLAGLLALVQFSALEIHAWAAQADRIDRPDRLILDLDPDESLSFAQVSAAALEIREFLHALELVSFPKTTGGKGLHLVVPLRRTSNWSAIKQFSETVAISVAAASPGRYTANQSKAARKGKIYIDYLRNTFGATAVACYSSRARANASVSAPVSWQEVEYLTSADAFTVSNLPRRLVALREDPWEGFFDIKQSVTKAKLEKLQRLLG